jgi:hypothetical protein
MTDSQTLAALFDREESLHPDLELFLEDSPIFGKMLRHPLVYSVPYCGIRENAYLNAQYEQKQKAVDAALTEKRWRYFINMYERPYRLMAFKMIHSHMSDKEYWECLSMIWEDSENIQTCLPQWKRFWKSKRPERHLVMDECDRESLAGMPERLMIFRGFAHKDGVKGCSWSLDGAKAEWFGRRSAQFEQLDHFHIARAMVDRNDVMAYFSGRNEFEIVVLPEKCQDIKVTRLVRT